MAKRKSGRANSAENQPSVKVYIAGQLPPNFMARVLAINGPFRRSPADSLETMLQIIELVVSNNQDGAVPAEIAKWLSSEIPKMRDAVKTDDPAQLVMQAMRLGVVIERAGVWKQVEKESKASAGRERYNHKRKAAAHDRAARAREIFDALPKDDRQKGKMHCYRQTAIVLCAEIKRTTGKSVEVKPGTVRDWLGAGD